jgi:hypothetical protein
VAECQPRLSAHHPKERGGRELPPKVVQNLLGHSSIVMTLDIYSHLFRDGGDRALNGVGGWSPNNGKPPTLAAAYSITSSAVERNSGEGVSPSARAVRRLTTKSNFDVA